MSNAAMEKVTNLERIMENLIYYNITSTRTSVELANLPLNSNAKKIQLSANIISKKSRKKSNKIQISTWNITTLLQLGKLNEVIDEIKSAKIDITAIQEIRWKGQGQVVKQGLTLYYSCDKEKNRSPRSRILDIQENSEICDQLRSRK